jgi:hypothetical protein
MDTDKLCICKTPDTKVKNKDLYKPCLIRRFENKHVCQKCNKPLIGLLHEKNDR